MKCLCKRQEEFLAAGLHCRSANDGKFLNMLLDSGRQAMATQRDIDQGLHGHGFHNAAAVMGVTQLQDALLVRH